MGYLANKCSIASRIDCFSEDSTTVFGSKLKEQVEDRLKFYETGDLPRKNVEVMAEAVEEAEENAADGINSTADESVLENGDSAEPPKKKKKKNKDGMETEVVTADNTLNTSVETETPKKKKKKNKDVDMEEGVVAAETTVNTTCETE